MSESGETATATTAPASPATVAFGEEDGLGTVLLDDRYQIERRLGAGGMGVVYAARDIQLGRAVAVKLVRPRVDSAAAQERLVREARAMARLRHPNVATVYDIGTYRDRLFIVMELIEGGTLADWLRAGRRRWREVVAMFLQAARGLAAAHAAAFVHRDFKPENVLVDKDGVARVTDFGVVRLVGDVEREVAERGAGRHTQTGAAVGTPGYIAPEILGGKSIDARADQFSFCVSLYAALYGRRPFAGPTEQPTLGPLRPPLAGGAPRWLARMIVRGLAREPGARWPDVATLAAALERRLGRRRWLVSLGLAGAVAAATATAVLATRHTPTPGPDWTPVLIARVDDATPWNELTVSRDGSTLVYHSSKAIWVEPRSGGPRRPVPLPAGVVAVYGVTPSWTGTHLLCDLEMEDGGDAYFDIDMASGRAVPLELPGAVPGTWVGIHDVAADGALLVYVGPSQIWRVDRSGATKLVEEREPGGSVHKGGWSPDGRRVAFQRHAGDSVRIEVLDLSTRQVSVVARHPCDVLDWLNGDALLCVDRYRVRSRVTELDLPARPGNARERLRYIGPEYQVIKNLRTTFAGTLLETIPVNTHMALAPVAPGARPERITWGGVDDLFPAGWTPSGSLVYGANVQGHLSIVARSPDGTIETLHTGAAAEVPLVVLGDTIVYGRFPGGEATIPLIADEAGGYPDGELLRLVPGAAPVALGATRGFVALLCAGGRAPPCLLLEHTGADVVAVDWDPATGARGRKRVSWRVGELRCLPSLAPDGRTLAVTTNTSSALTLLDLDTGQRRPVAAPGITDYYWTGWQPDGTLLAQYNIYSENSAPIVRLRDPLHPEILVRDTAHTLLGRFLVSPDGKTIALEVHELAPSFWWVPRSSK